MTQQPPKRSWTHGRLGALILLIIALFVGCQVDRANQDTTPGPSSGYSTHR